MSNATIRDEFRTPCSPEGLQVIEISSDSTRDSTAFYLDCSSWSNDSRLLAFRREASDDGSKPAGLWICDTENDFAVEPIVEYHEGRDAEHNVRNNSAPVPGQSYDSILAPDGKAVYHLIRIADTVEVRKIDIANRKTEVIATAPAPLLSRGHHSISADGKRLCMGNFLGNGKTEGAPWGAYIFDLDSGEHQVIEFGNGFRNMHCAYSPDPSPEASHDLLVGGTSGLLSDGSWLTPPDGSWRWENMPPDEGLGSSILVVRDDGTNWRMLPIGRKKSRFTCHNIWRGSAGSIVAQRYDHAPGLWRSPFLEASPIPVHSEEDKWLGETHPDAHPVDITRKLARADGCHFGFDKSGKHFVSDSDGYCTPECSFLYVGTYHESSTEDPFVSTRYLALPRTSWKTQESHPHAFLSPDGRRVVFQSDFTGRPQVYVAYNFDYPADI